MKRTLALILALVMVLPVSFISALAHGPGVGKNETNNQSIHNAENQPIPETVTVDGDYTDTAWDKDEWNEVDKRFGVWDVVDPIALNYSYKYQLKLDAYYLYGVYVLSNTSADQITIWLNDGTGENTYTNEIILPLNGDKLGTVTLDGKTTEEAEANPAGGKVFPAEKFQSATKKDGSSLVVEFRICLKSFTAKKSFSHFTAVRVTTGDKVESLYYPKVALENETIPESPLVEWPDNAIVIDRIDIEDANSNKHLPSDVTVDGNLDEVVWNNLTDFRLQKYTTQQQADAVENNTSAPLDLLSVGYSTHHTTSIATHYHKDNNGAYSCNGDGGCGGRDLNRESQMRFKYELRTDGTNLYGAVVLLNLGHLKHNIPTNYAQSGVTGWADHYDTLNYLQIDFYDKNGKALGNSGYKLEIVNDSSNDGKNSYFNLLDGWSSYGEVDYKKTDGTTETVTYNQAMKWDKNAGSLHYDQYLTTYEFEIPLKYLGLKESDGSFQVVISSYEEGDLLSYTTSACTTTVSKNTARKYSYTDKVTVKTNNTNGVKISYNVNGGLQPSEWNSLLAADKQVNGMYRKQNGQYVYDDGNVKTYQYEVVADYDYIYGAALIVTDDSAIQKGGSEEANAFRLWLNDGSAGSWSQFVNCVSFYLDKNSNTVVSIASSGKNATYTKSGKYFERTVSGKVETLYGLDAKMRVLDEEDMPAAQRTRFSNMYKAIEADKVAVVEFRIPLDLVGLDMDYYRSEEKTHPAQIRYYVNACLGLNTAKGILVPMQKDAQSESKYLFFTPNEWCTNGDKVIYNNEDYYDNVRIDGIRTENFWNDYSDFIGVNASTGYYSQGVDADDLFTFGNTIKVSRDHIYGYAILNAEAVPGVSNYTLYINTDPSYRNPNVITNANSTLRGATHAFVFSVEDDGQMVCTAYDYTDGISKEMTIGNEIEFSYNTINGYSNIEFAIDTRIFDTENENLGYEYCVSVDTQVNGVDVVTLTYPDPRKASNERFTGLELTHFNNGAVAEGAGMIVTKDDAGTYDGRTNNSDGSVSFKFNGWANLYVLFEKVNTQTDTYKVVNVVVNPNGTKPTFKIGENQFLYFVYTGVGDNGAVNNPDPTRRTALYNKYKNDFKVGSLVEFQDLDLTGNYLDRTKYRILDAENTIFVNYVNHGNYADVCQIITKLPLEYATSIDPNGKEVNPNGHADYYIAFAPTTAAGVYQVVGVDDDDFLDGDGDGDGKFDLTLPAGGFIYSMRYEDSDVDTYAKALHARLTVGTYVHIDDLKIANPEAASLGYRYMDTSIWEGRNANLPSKNNWESEIALKIDTLEYFYPETITVDGVLNDNGWDPNAWTHVELGVNGSLQSKDYEATGAESFDYSYQLRTDGEYVYVAAILETDGSGKEVIETGKDGTTATHVAIPSFRIWIKSNNATYDKAISFTHLYDVRLGLDNSVDSQQYKNYSAVKQSTFSGINLTASGQTSASTDWYFSSGNVTGPDDVIIGSDKSISYSGTVLRFAEHLPNGYLFPWGGVADGSGKATVKNYTEYGSTALYGETEEDMENMTTGINNGDENKWYAHTDTQGFSIGNEHGAWKTSIAEDGEPLSIVEFKFKLSEIGCENGEGFEYYVQGAHSGTDTLAPFTLFNPATRHIPYQSDKGFDNYHLPFWRWESSTSSKFNASTSYNMTLRNNYGPAISLGTKVSDDYDGKGSNAIRFGGLYTEDYIRKQIVTNNKVNGYQTTDTKDWTDRVLDGANKDGITNYWDVSSVGIVFQFTQKLTDELTLQTPNVGTSESVGIYQHRKDTNFADYENYVFYITLNGLPDAYKNVKFSFRSYVTYYGADGSPAYYDQVLERTWNEVANGGYYTLPDELPNQGGNTPGVTVTKPDYNDETIAYLPLDNRPVNIDRAEYLAESSGFNITMPPAEYIDTIINNADTPEDDSETGNVEKIFEWLQTTYAQKEEDGKTPVVKYYVISLDLLFSGGLVGSRDFAGINSLPNAASDGAYYDPNLAKEKEIVAFLETLTSDPNTKVVFFDSQMRLASTGQFNGFISNDNTDGDGDGYYDNHYTFLRSVYAMGARPAVNVESSTALQDIIKGYEKNANGSYFLTTFVNTNNHIINGCYTNGNKDTSGTIYNSDGTVKNGYVDYQYRTWATSPSSLIQNRISYSMIDRYLKSRARKLQINELIFQTDIIKNSEYFYIGVDDSNPDPSIQTVEAEWLTHYGEEQNEEGFSLFAGIDEIGLMSMAALVTKLYGGVYTGIEYFGPDGAENFPADDYGNNTLHANMIAHIEGVGSTWGATKSNRNALHILVLTKKSEENGYGTAYDADDDAVNALITRLKYLISEGMAVAVVDASGGTRSKLGHAMQNSGVDLGMVLGYSNWNTVANATGISVSNAVARYAYLRNSANITEASHEGFFKGITYSYVKDIGYIIDYKGATPSMTDTLANRSRYKSVFDTTAKDLIKKINTSKIMTAVGESEDIGDITITKDLYWPWNREFEASFDLGMVEKSILNSSNVTSGKTYSFEGTLWSPGSSESRATNDGKKLTDGVETESYTAGTKSINPNNAVYTATGSSSNATVIFDLGSEQNLTGIKAVGMSAPWGIAKIAKIDVYVSNDGSTYEKVDGILTTTDVYTTATADDGREAVYNYCTFQFEEIQNAKHVKIVFTPGNQFIWLSEVEAYAAA